jgi:Protein of unknown function (DUF2752)
MMEVTRRRLARGEIDHELLWLSVSIASLGIAAVWFAAGLPWPRCLLHELTSVPCVTCGMTRCAIAFLHADFATAMQWNPLIFVMLCALSIFDVYAFTVVVTGAPRLRIRVSRIGAKYVRGAVAGALVLNWIYLLVHWQKF